MPIPCFVEVPVPALRPDGSVILDPQGRPVPKRDQNGRPVIGVAINPNKQATKAYWIVSDPVTVVLAGSAGANIAGAASELEFLIDTQGHFDWAAIIGSSTGAYSLGWFDCGTNRDLQNKPSHSGNIVGSGVRPFRLPEPYFLNVGDSQRMVKATLRDLSGANNTVKLTMYGRRFYHKEAAPQVAMDYQERFGGGWRTYSYFLNPKETNPDGTVDVVPGLGTTTLTFEADDSADTEIQKCMVNATGTFSYQLRERDTDRMLSGGVIANVNGWGTAEFPFHFADTFLLERKKALLLLITDLSGSDNFIYPTLAGRRLHYR
jgi:hypothetical protein